MADIEAGAEGNATVLVARSKTDQEDMGMVRYIAPDTCRHIDAWTAAAEITEGLLLRSVGRGGRWAGRSTPATWLASLSAWPQPQ